MDNISINIQDAINLKNDPSATNKMSIAHKVGLYYNDIKDNHKIRIIIEDIFRLLIRDTEIKVREVLVECLKDSKNLPQDIVYSIINDIDFIAAPFIQYYKDFSDENLIEILNTPNNYRHKAIAKRKNLSEKVSDAISMQCSEDVIKELINNNTASIHPNSFIRIIDKHPGNEAIQQCLVYRANLPFIVIEKIINQISYKLKTQLLTRQNLPSDFATDLINEIKEKLTLKLSEDYSQEDLLRKFIMHLHKSNKLTHSLVTRAICTGDLEFFEQSISLLAETPIEQVQKILFNNHIDFEIRNLLRKALLPKSTFPAILNALKIINEIRFDCCNSNNRVFSRKVIERILSSMSSNDELSSEEINYLISKIN
jgi:uncharacterized protein (DUF2336 family)